MDRMLHYGHGVGCRMTNEDIRNSFVSFAQSFLGKIHEMWCEVVRDAMTVLCYFNMPDHELMTELAERIRANRALHFAKSQLKEALHAEYSVAKRVKKRRNIIMRTSTYQLDAELRKLIEAGDIVEELIRDNPSEADTHTEQPSKRQRVALAEGSR